MKECAVDETLKITKKILYFQHQANISFLTFVYQILCNNSNINITQSKCNKSTKLCLGDLIITTLKRNGPKPIRDGAIFIKQGGPVQILKNMDVPY